ncbi:MAG: hypothetical protein QW273_01945 [Candidatus Pacearchaeota archaeon]
MADKNNKPTIQSSPEGFAGLRYPFINENSKPTEGQKFENFFHTNYKNFKELSSLNLKEEKDREKFFSYFDDSQKGFLSSMDLSSLEKYKDNLTNVALDGLIKNSHKNLESLLSVHSDEDIENISLDLNHIYGKDSPDNYKAIVKRINEYQKLQNTNEVGYVVEKMKRGGLIKDEKELNDFEKISDPVKLGSIKFYLGSAEIILKSDILINSRLIKESLSSYGSKKFFKDSIETAKKLYEKYEKKELAFLKEYEEEMKRKKGYLSAKEELEFLNKFKENHKEDFEEYENAIKGREVFNKNLVDLMEKTYKEIDEKMKKEEEKNKKGKN